MPAKNRIVTYVKPGVVELRDYDYPKLEMEYRGKTRACPHGVIGKVVSTNVCGSDQHMVRGRTTAPEGQTLGHEITIEIVESTRSPIGGSDAVFAAVATAIWHRSGWAPRWPTAG